MINYFLHLIPNELQSSHKKKEFSLSQNLFSGHSDDARLVIKVMLIILLGTG